MEYMKVILQKQVLLLCCNLYKQSALIHINFDFVNPYKLFQFNYFNRSCDINPINNCLISYNSAFPSDNMFCVKIEASGV